MSNDTTRLRFKPFRNQPIEKRFWEKVMLPQEPNGCWEWRASLNNKGYGKINIDGKIVLAHRVAYSLYCGDIPPNMCVLHQCDNPKCVNPNHLFLGTLAENVHDMIVKGRAIFFGGEKRRPKYKHSDTLVCEVVRLRKNGLSYSAIGKQIGLSTSSVVKLVKRGTRNG